MPHDVFLELRERSGDYYAYMKKKHAFKDQLLLCILVPIMLLNVGFNSVAGVW